jgi:outer membrane protein assembly factor BamD (BamD/ComL family)
MGRLSNMALPILGLILACLLSVPSMMKRATSSLPETAEGQEKPSTPHGLFGSASLSGLGAGSRAEGALADTKQPDLLDSTHLQQFLANSNPHARSLFESGLRSFRRDDFTGALREFHTLAESYPGDKANALADWIRGAAYYRLGGIENLRSAVAQFTNFVESYNSDPELDELVQAGQIDIAVIQIELTRYASGEAQRVLEEMRLNGNDPETEARLFSIQEEMVKTAAFALQNLSVFVQIHPHSPYAPSAIFSLQQLWDLLAEPH